MFDNIKILRNYLLYFLSLLLVCIVGISNVFAITYEDVGYLNNYSDVTVEVTYTSSPLPLTIDNTYQLAQVEAMNIIVNNFTFLAGTTYSLEFWTPNTKLQYANAISVIGNDSNNRPITCSSIGIDNQNLEFLNFKFNCSTNVNAITLRIYNSSNNYIMDSGIFSWKYVYLRKITSSTDTSILESQNAQIIQGQQDIINNQNQNTQEQIESQKVCNIYSKDNIIEQNKYLNISGILSSKNNVGVTDYLSITSNDDLYRFNNLTFADNIALCFYNSKKTLINCFYESTSNDYQEVNKKFDIPNNAKFVRFSIDVSRNLPQFQICRNGNQVLNDSITGLNDSLNDDDSSGATSEASEFFSSFTTNTFGLTSIITAPLNLIQSLTSSTCSVLHLPLPYLSNKYLDLPCMTSIYQTHFGSFFTMYQTITYGIIAYWVIVRIFNQVKDFKNPEHDEIEVVDL